MNPDLLAPGAPVLHVGTTDVDVLLQLGFVFDRDDLDFAWLENALDFAEPMQLGWRWLDRTSGVPVAIELLCDVEDNPGRSISLPGADRLAAINLRGPRAALREPVTRVLAVPSDMREQSHPAQIEVRFASLGGYLCAKASAMLGRDAAKDAYDFMYVALYNPDGVQGASDAIEAELRALPKLRTDIIAALRRYTRPDRAAARTFAGQIAQTPEEVDASTEDAVSAAAVLLDRLGASGGVAAL